VNAKALAKHYDNLTAEERFRLILAAVARGERDEAERLMRVAPPTTIYHRAL
jgi:hypothetical protein